MRMPLRAFCPMGCGETLVAEIATHAHSAHIVCTSPGCPRPDAADNILREHHLDVHVVTISERGFSVTHPLHERLDGQLHKCKLHEEIAAKATPFDGEGRQHEHIPPGRYAVTRLPAEGELAAAIGDDGVARKFEGWLFERLDGHEFDLPPDPPPSSSSVSHRSP